MEKYLGTHSQQQRKCSRLLQLPRNKSHDPYYEDMKKSVRCGYEEMNMKLYNGRNSCDAANGGAMTTKGIPKKHIDSVRYILRRKDKCKTSRGSQWI